MSEASNLSNLVGVSIDPNSPNSTSLMGELIKLPHDSEKEVSSSGSSISIEPTWETKMEVFTLITLQTFFGLCGTGLFYGLGAMAEYINIRFHPEEPFSFHHQHGIFGAVLILVCSSGPMPIVQAYYDFINNPKNKASKVPRISEKTLHLIACAMVIGGFFLCGISLQFRLVWLYYLGCCIPSGIGGVIIYRRCVFNHQLWYKSINLLNIGSGLFGFIIGLWTIIFFLITVPLILHFSIEKVLYIYAALVTPMLLFSALTISDNSIPGSAPASPSSPPPLPILTSTSISTSASITLSSLPSSSTDYSLLKTDEEAPAIEMVVCSSKNSYNDNKNNSSNNNNNNNNNNINNNNSISCDHNTIFVEPKLSCDNDFDSMSDHDLKLLFDKYNIIYEYVQRSSKIPPSILNIYKKTAEVKEEKNWHFEFPISSYEALFIPEQYLITIFFTAILTPGWGIKLAAISMLLKTFEVAFVEAAEVATVYVTLYAIGRLISGFVAETRLGLFYTYYIIILGMMTLLLVLPSTSISSMPHIGYSSRGCSIFMACIWVIGLLYGGGVALFYSIVMELFGVKNYRAVFSVTVVGFALSCTIGGISSSYSFADTANQSKQEAQALAATWYYCMAAACFISFVILLTIRPYNYRRKLIEKLKEKLKSTSPAVDNQKKVNVDYLSSRAKPFFRPSYPYIMAQINARSDIFDANTNFGGKLPFAVAENKLCHDILIEKVNSFATSTRKGGGVGYSLEVFNYTNPTGHPILKDAMAAFLSKYLFSNHKIKPEHLVISPGCVATLQQLSLLLFEPGDTVLIPTPYYPAFVGDFLNLGTVNVFDVHNKSGLEGGHLNTGLDINSLENGYVEAINSGSTVRALLLCNPNNPLGTVYSSNDIKAAIVWARTKKLFIICDEIYALSCFDDETFTSVVSLVNNDLGNDIFVLWSFSKDFGASGLRLGVLYCQNEMLLKAMSGSNDAFQVSNLIQEMCTFLIQDDVFLNKFISSNRQRLKGCFDRLKRGLNSLGISMIASQSGIFAYVDFRPFLKEVTFQEEALLSEKFNSKGLIFTPGQVCHTPVPGYFRICYAWLADTQAIDELVRRVGNIGEDIRRRLRE